MVSTRTRSRKREPLFVTSSAMTGLVLMIAGATAGLAAYLLGQEGKGDWVLAAYLWLSVLALGIYVTFVYWPSVVTARRLAALREEIEEHQQALREVLDELRDGDLVAMTQRSRGLPGPLAEAVTAATGALSRLVSELQQSSVEIAAAGSRVHRNASELAAGSSEQAAAVVQITATMDQLARTAAQIAGNAGRQAREATEVRSRGEAGAEAVAAAATGVERVRGHITEIGERAAILDRRSKEIFGILELINEIARETHILSLNASIEASDTGTAGGRFSAVAEEIGRLAERSRESVGSVRSIVEELQAAIRDTVVATEQGQKAADDVAAQARAAAEAIEALRRSIGEIEREAREISAATEEQKTASDQMALTLREVGDVVQREAASLQEFQNAAANLGRLALSLQLLAQAFRAESPRSLRHRALVWAAELAEIVQQPQLAKESLERLIADNGFVELAYLVDEHGKMVAWAAAEKVPAEKVREAVQAGRDYSDRPWFQAAQRARGAVLTPEYESMLTGEPCFTAAAQLPGGGGVVGVDVNLRSWTEI